MIKAIAIDDEPPALKLIENFCSEVSFIELEKTFTSPADALKYLAKFPVDLLFLDINMPSLSGIELYKEVKQDTMAIFTTAHSEYAVEGFNLNAVDFLLKPFTIERFMQAVNKANDFYQYQHPGQGSVQQFLFIRADYSLMKIPIADILYVESYDDYLKIHIYNQKMVVTRMTMKSILDKLPATEFIRIHRSYIIAFSRIESVRAKSLMISGMELPIGASYDENLQRILRGL